jgi:SAM-dependent methyltransferase
VQSNQSPEFAAAAEVQDFYERYPYPRPVDSLDKYRQLWQDPQRRRADHHLFQPSRPYREDPSILIAGCGTSQAAKHAVRWPAARVTGIDFSATSVRCTEALRRKYKLDNLDLHQLAVERAGEPARSSTRSSAPACCTTWPTPTPACKRCASCSSPTACCT